MNETELRFTQELEVFRTEAESAAQYFYGYLAVHELARRRKAVFDLLNENALFWNTAVSGLQVSAMIALGRVFDADPRTHRLDGVIAMAKSHIEIFSKDALRRRKRGAVSVDPPWLADCIRDAYVPAQADFKRLKARINQHRKLYHKNVDFIRNRILAHNEDVAPSEMARLLSNTRVAEIQRLIVFLLALHEALSQLFENGRRPVLRQARYSVARMRKLPSLAKGGSGVHETMVGEVARVLGAAGRPRRACTRRRMAWS